MIKQDRQTRARINPHLKAALKVFVPLRIMASLWAVIIISLFPATTEIEHVPTDLAASAPHNGALSTWLIKPWFRWDTQWYTAIARNGYERPGSTTFLPFYPLLTPGPDFDPFDLSAADRTGPPGDTDVDFALGADPIELDLGDEIAQQLLALLHGGAGCMPNGRQILRQAPDVALLFVGE